MFVADMGALASDPHHASARRCRAVLGAATRIRSWLTEREVQWMARLVEAEGRDQPTGAFSRALAADEALDLPQAS